MDPRGPAGLSSRKGGEAGEGKASRGGNKTLRGAAGLS